ISSNVFNCNGKCIPIIYQINTQPHRRKPDDIKQYDRVMRYEISSTPRPIQQEEQFEEEIEPPEEKTHSTERSYIPW
ncbi:hypothetical protein KY348_01760, partial [Candidatus Woesearchaeota archaeon]|nr:hypothetical protein [Candidatus Woesearchaeota archaeon]